RRRPRKRATSCAWDCRGGGDGYRPRSPSGGEWGLVAAAVFKTVVPARKRGRVGSIPTRLRQPRSAPFDHERGRSIDAAMEPPRIRTIAPSAAPIGIL